MNALLSIMGLYEADETLFDDMAVPEALDKPTLINNIIIELAELNTIISDPAIMKIAIKHWSNSRIDVWEHLQETLEYDYNPIWNKDGVIKEKETRDLKGTLDGSSTIDRSAFDSNTYQPVEKQQVDNDSTDTGTVTRERTEQGNIGITTTQQMIKEEREIAEFNLYSLIIDEFKRRFCIMVY